MNTRDFAQTVYGVCRRVRRMLPMFACAMLCVLTSGCLRWMEPPIDRPDWRDCDNEQLRLMRRDIQESPQGGTAVRLARATATRRGALYCDIVMAMAAPETVGREESEAIKRVLELNARQVVNLMSLVYDFDEGDSASMERSSSRTFSIRGERKSQLSLAGDYRPVTAWRNDGRLHLLAGMRAPVNYFRRDPPFLMSEVREWNGYAVVLIRFAFSIGTLDTAAQPLLPEEVVVDWDRMAEIGYRVPAEDSRVTVYWHTEAE